MKPIELTEDQKNRLLEMCKALFPEYHKWCFYHPISKANMIVAFKKDNDSDLYDNCDIFIHWFEFCMTHLAEKIFNPKDRNTAIIKNNFEAFYMEMNAYSWFIQDPGVRESFADHPVDYIYKEFKKLKPC